MADIAVVFHWSLESMEAMEFSEILAWRERAAKRCEVEEK